MIKQIALPIAVIAIAAGTTLGATGAFFSDSETSGANTFTAATLKLDVKGAGEGSADSNGTFTLVSGAMTGLLPGDMKNFSHKLKPVGGDTWFKATVVIDEAASPLVGAYDVATMITKQLTGAAVPMTAVSDSVVAGVRTIVYTATTPLTAGEEIIVSGNACLGDLVAGSPVTCDGSNVGNQAQNATVNVSLTYDVEQATNNPTNPFLP
ncbi:hypothetical protein A3C89_04225 [Candidatus Kaiserbacteria bacterium RIFCSPHIGHO2_02_FULL_50_50]|uniref:DUF5666 domain-containing protein n=1 Tax=Candidatus Kaiserbacteria bacterium RIFCSPHIGHO2_02_FULL_50_50 TaxID=1798492 RepID=A0A1F6DDI0_9BACT|nr:MAG: hypothetical protein A3C89_04225 [Candidatus Kaiserbacteria bacterium RIFCSPHIGHO2_02_FULL_50_50]OGG89063.1 MAG: hypothetical protein A3G62_03995 [Candidatus Kaiserbacteria bacterium RIFCSPLOWO2_12_FULL_50_10]